MPTRGASTSISANSSLEPRCLGPRCSTRGRAPRHAAMSSRRWDPSKSIMSAAAYAAARAAARSSPSAVTPSTRPPAVTTSPSRSAVPAWKTSTPARDAVEPADDVARRGARRVAAGGEHDADRGARVPLELRARQAARLGRGEQQREQVGAQPRQHDLRLGIAEADVELEHLRAPSGAEHQARVEDAVERRAAARELVDDGLVDGRDHVARRARRPPGTGEKQPMPPVFGPVSPSPIRL